jgi:hypothetical protein
MATFSIEGIKINNYIFFRKVKDWLNANIGPTTSELLDDEDSDIISYMNGDGWSMKYIFVWDQVRLNIEFNIEDDCQAVALALLIRDWV